MKKQCDSFDSLSCQKTKPLFYFLGIVSIIIIIICYLLFVICYLLFVSCLLLLFELQHDSLPQPCLLLLLLFFEKITQFYY